MRFFTRTGIHPAIQVRDRLSLENAIELANLPMAALPRGLDLA
jgi:hypothetical protein